MKETFIKVADAYFNIQFTEEELDNRELLPSYAPFSCKRPAPDTPLLFTMTVGSTLVDREPEGEELGQFDCGGVTHGVFRTTDGGYKFQLRNVQGEIACALRTSADFTTCQASLFREDKLIRAYGLNNALMISFAYAGAAHGIVLMHASVTVFKEKGYLFLGSSGTGKSTHSSLWIKHIQGCELLNDDNPAVRATSDGRITVYGSPWSGKTPCYRNLHYPVGAFVRLKQYPENLIERENVLKSFASILSSCSTMIWDKPSYNRICDNVTSIISHVPCYYLRCLPDEAAARLCNSTVTTSEAL